MAQLIRNVSGESGIGYGVNVWEVSPPKAVRAPGSSTVFMVADLPWGPVNTVIDISNGSDFFDRFAPAAFGNLDDYPALKAVINKRFPRLKVVRIDADDAATAAQTFEDASVGDSVTVTAKYQGVSGNLINIEWVANADTGANRDAIVTIGSTYSRRYENVAIPGSGDITVTDPGDPYVTFSKASGATAVPEAAAAAPLAGGADGTATAANYVGSSSLDEGIRLAYSSSVAANVLFCAEVPSDLIDAVNTGIEAWANDNEKGIGVLCTVASQTKAAALTYVADYRSDRLWYPWPLVKTTNTFDAALGEATVQGASFVAALVAQTDAWRSPGGAGSAAALTGITGLETESASAADLDELNDGGIAPFFMSTKHGGAIVHKAVTTSLESGKAKVRRRRYTDYLSGGISDLLEEYTEFPLDLDLENQALGPITAVEVGGIKSFLEAEQDLTHLETYTVDPFSGANASDIAAGRWTIIARVKYFSDQDEIVLKLQAGDNVQVAA